jgi:hypothetical protein
MGISGEPRNELEFSTRGAGLGANPWVPTGGVEAPRPSRLFRSSAFSSAALAFICVTGRGGVGLTVEGKLKGDGENWHTEISAKRLKCIKYARDLNYFQQHCIHGSCTSCRKRVEFTTHT